MSKRGRQAHVQQTSQQKQKREQRREANTHPRPCGNTNEKIGSKGRVTGNCRRQRGGDVGRCSTLPRLWATSQVDCPVLTREEPTSAHAGQPTLPPSSSRRCAPLRRPHQADEKDRCRCRSITLAHPSGKLTDTLFPLKHRPKAQLQEMQPLSVCRRRRAARACDRERRENSCQKREKRDGGGCWAWKHCPNLQQPGCGRVSFLRRKSVMELMPKVGRSEIARRSKRGAPPFAAAEIRRCHSGTDNAEWERPAESTEGGEDGGSSTRGSGSGGDGRSRPTRRSEPERTLAANRCGAQHCRKTKRDLSPGSE